MFEFHDKTGKQLAWVLSNFKLKKNPITLKRADGEMSMDEQKTLQIFSVCFSSLYASEGTQQDDWETFFLLSH